MIRSLPSEPTAWLPPVKRTVVVIPHPDDEVLAAGGVILHQRAHGVPVVAVAVTDGDAAYPDWDATNATDLRTVRLGEQRAAFAELGIHEGDVVRLGLPDGHVAKHESELVTRLCEVVQAGDLLVAPWVHDHHVDHEACGRAARAVAASAGCELIATLVWAWRFVALTEHADVELLRLRLDASQARARWSAMQCHRSQFDPPAGEPVVDDDLLALLGEPTAIYLRERR